MGVWKGLHHGVRTHGRDVKVGDTMYCIIVYIVLHPAGGCSKGGREEISLVNILEGVWKGLHHGVRTHGRDVKVGTTSSRKEG